MLALLALVLASARPPAAYVATPAGHVPLAVSSWCLGTACGAPISASTKVAAVTRNSTVRVELAFIPTRVRLAIDGTALTPAVTGHEISWSASRGGGITLTAYKRNGWITYVGRIRLRR